MNFKHLIVAFAASSVLAPSAMAKATGGLRIKHVQAKAVAGKSKKAPAVKPSMAPKTKKPRKNKSTKRNKSEGAEI